MPANKAWQRHGCYKLGSEQFFNFPLQSALIDCYDDSQSLDHFDPTKESRRLFKQFNYLRSQYASLTDGLALVQRGNWTHFEQLPGSNGTPTELGLWSASRAGIPNAQTLTGTSYTADVWFLYTNENQTQTYTHNCNGSDWISTPFVSGTTVRNLFSPYESYTLETSQSSFFDDGQAPYVGCLGSITMEPLSFKLLVPETDWVSVPPMLTKFSPGHDARLLSVDGGDNSTSVQISLEFNVEMDCDSITNALTLNMSTSSSTTPSISNAQCGAVSNPDPAAIIGSDTSAYAWNATIVNFPDGILHLTLNNPSASNGNTTGAVDHLLLRKGTADNVMVFPDADYKSDSFTKDGNTYTFTHSAVGADKFRYSVDFGQTWTTWQDYENSSNIDNSTFFDSSSNWWGGQHIIVQCKLKNVFVYQHLLIIL